MTVQTTSSRAGPFSGNGANRLWATTFRIDLPGDLQVIYTDLNGIDHLVDSSAFTVTGIGDPLGISVTYPMSGPAIGSGEKITLLRNVSYDQQTSITNQGGFYPAVIERALDRIVFQCQQLAEKMARTVTVPVSTLWSSLVFPGPVGGQYLRGRADGTGWENASLVVAGGIGVPVAIGEGGTAASNITQARANLGATTVGDAVFTASNPATARSALGLGSAAVLTAGTAANNAVQLDNAAKLPAVDASQLVGTGRLLNIVTITASGSYSKNAASSYVVVYVIGGGGGAGSVAGGASIVVHAGGGAGGGCSVKKILSSILNNSEIVTIGLGGNGASTAAVAAGQSGGTTSFGTWCSATGGAGGPGSNGGGLVGAVAAGGIGGGGDINLQGEGAAAGYWFSNTSSNYLGGRAAGPFGGPGAVGNYGPGTSAMAALANTGGGAAGATSPYNSATPITAGGNGGSGVVYVFEYA